MRVQVPAAASHAYPHALTPGFRPTVLFVPLSPVIIPLSQPRKAPSHLPRPHTDPPPPCSPRAGAAVTTQESRLRVCTHTAAAPWGATRGHSQPHSLVTKPHAQSHWDTTGSQPHVPEGTVQ